jgi:hypothetical protein
MTHLATDVTGHAFVNQISGGPFRTHWQRHHLVENHLDAAQLAVAGLQDASQPRRNAGTTSSGGSRSAARRGAHGSNQAFACQRALLQAADYAGLPRRDDCVLSAH